MSYEVTKTIVPETKTIFKQLAIAKMPINSIIMPALKQPE